MKDVKRVGYSYGVMRLKGKTDLNSLKLNIDLK